MVHDNAYNALYIEGSITPEIIIQHQGVEHYGSACGHWVLSKFFIFVASQRGAGLVVYADPYKLGELGLSRTSRSNDDIVLHPISLAPSINTWETLVCSDSGGSTIFWRMQGVY